MVFKRKIYDKLIEWKNLSGGRSALLIEGARRVGKSTIAELFAKKEYDDYILLDFAKEGNSVKDNFRENIGNLDTFFRNLFLAKGKELLPGKSVIIFDEVQLFPIARQSIKYLVRDGRYDYIETGSLISIKKNVKDILIPSEEHKLKMFPMDFEEFLWASGDTFTSGVIRENFEIGRGFGDGAHRTIMKKYREYLAVGGMPQAVEAFVSGKSYAAIDYIKQDILNLYEDDLRKHDEGGSEKASIIFKTIPEQLHNHNSHFKFSLVDRNARYRDYVDAVDFVAQSMIGNECINITKPEIPLESYADRGNFKLYLGDTGLLITQIMTGAKDTTDDLYKALIFDKLGINQGMIFENAVAQALRVNGHSLYFHDFLYKESEVSSEKKYEIDFVIVKNKKICPIEVKSSNYRTHRSFDVFYEKYNIKSERKYIIYTKDYREENAIRFIPVYMSMCL